MFLVDWFSADRASGTGFGPCAGCFSVETFALDDLVQIQPAARIARVKAPERHGLPLGMMVGLGYVRPAQGTRPRMTEQERDQIRSRLYYAADMGPVPYRKADGSSAEAYPLDMPEEALPQFAYLLPLSSRQAPHADNDP